MTEIKDMPLPQEKLLVVELAKSEDAAGIARVRKETWLATYPNEEVGVTKEDILSKNLDSEEEIALWRGSIENPKGTRKIWVAKDGGVVVGYGQGKKGEVENQIYGLYVLPSQQRKGLGRKLMQQVMEWLGDEKLVTLSVATYSTSAIELYKQFDFEMTDEIVLGPEFPSGARIPSVKMVRPVKV